MISACVQPVGRSAAEKESSYKAPEQTVLAFPQHETLVIGADMSSLIGRDLWIQREPWRQKIRSEKCESLDLPLFNTWQAVATQH